MKKLMVIASLCILAAVLAPITSASAAGEKYKGKCTIHGSTTFSGGTGKLEAKPQAELGYSFTGVAKCEETAPPNKKLEGTATVSGKGRLSCAVSASEGEGPGTLLLKENSAETDKKFPFHLTFTSAGPGTVALVAKFDAGGGVATGEANFLNSTEQPAKECFTAGVTALQFEAEAAGELTN